MERTHKNKLDCRVETYAVHYNSLNKENKLTQRQHTLIIKTFFTIVVREMVNNMYRFHFIGLGWFYLIKTFQEVKLDPEGKVVFNACIDWSSTKDIISRLGNKKRVKFLNEHTNGYTYSILWYKKHTKFTNRSFYSFELCRNVKRYMAKTIFSNIKPLNAYIR